MYSDQDNELGSMVDSAKGRIYTLTHAEILIGRSKTNDIVLSDDLSVSRKHARILHENGRYYIEDLNSSNGTAINGKEIKGRTVLEPDDLVLLGRRVFIFSPTKEPITEQLGTRTPVANATVSVMRLRSAVISTFNRLLKPTAEGSAKPNELMCL